MSLLPIYKQPLCDCANSSARCLGLQPGRACQAHDRWWALPCNKGKCPGWMHPDCCGKSPDHETQEDAGC